MPNSLPFERGGRGGREGGAERRKIMEMMKMKIVKRRRMKRMMMKRRRMKRMKMTMKMIQLVQ